MKERNRLITKSLLLWYMLVLGWFAVYMWWWALDKTPRYFLANLDKHGEYWVELVLFTLIMLVATVFFVVDFKRDYDSWRKKND